MLSIQNKHLWLSKKRTLRRSRSAHLAFLLTFVSIAYWALVSRPVTKSFFVEPAAQHSLICLSFVMWWTRQKRALLIEFFLDLLSHRLLSRYSLALFEANPLLDFRWLNEAGAWFWPVVSSALNLHCTSATKQMATILTSMLQYAAVKHTQNMCWSWRMLTAKGCWSIGFFGFFGILCLRSQLLALHLQWRSDGCCPFRLLAIDLHSFWDFLGLESRSWNPNLKATENTQWVFQAQCFSSNFSCNPSLCQHEQSIMICV